MRERERERERESKSIDAYYEGRGGRGVVVAAYIPYHTMYVHDTITISHSPIKPHPPMPKDHHQPKPT